MDEQVLSAEEVLTRAVAESVATIQKLPALGGPLSVLAQAIMGCWGRRGKVLLAGNGGSMTDAMHCAEELSVRFKRNRRALAALALCDPSAITCSGNDFGFETIFERQVEALGNPGDVLIVFSTSGNSSNILRAVAMAKQMKLYTAAFGGGTGGTAGGALAGQCDVELIVPSTYTSHIQEGHTVLYHALCDWIDRQV